MNVFKRTHNTGIIPNEGQSLFILKTKCFPVLTSIILQSPMRGPGPGRDDGPAVGVLQARVLCGGGPHVREPRHGRRHTGAGHTRRHRYVRFLLALYAAEGLVIWKW